MTSWLGKIFRTKKKDEYRTKEEAEQVEEEKPRHFGEKSMGYLMGFNDSIEMTKERKPEFVCQQEAAPNTPKEAAKETTKVPKVAKAQPKPPAAVSTKRNLSTASTEVSLQPINENCRTSSALMKPKVANLPLMAKSIQDNLASAIQDVQKIRGELETFL